MTKIGVGNNGVMKQYHQREEGTSAGRVPRCEPLPSLPEHPPALLCAKLMSSYASAWLIDDVDRTVDGRPTR